MERPFMESSLIDWLFKGVLGILAVLGFFMKRTLNQQDKEIEDIKKEQQKQRDAAADWPKTYLSKDDFKEFKSELRSMFDDLKQDIRALKQ